jgi:hypothetical protein
MKNKKWSHEEESYLQESWGTISIKGIAKNLGRTETAIIVKVARMGLGPYLESGGYVTYNQLLMTLYGATNIKNVYRTKEEWSDFPIKYKLVNNSKFKVVYIDDFWKWAEKNKRLIDFSKMDEFALGAEPDWAKKKRKIDFECRRLKTPWTNAEDQKLEYLLKKQCYTYTDLARELHRTEGAIRRRIWDLALDIKPVRAKTRLWTEEETEELKRLYEEGWSIDMIGIKLNRTGQSVRGKIGTIK